MRTLDPEVAHERKRAILDILIHQYVKSGAPVGSQAVTQHLSQELSSATVRHILAELEGDGYLAQPHASSGRIPTDKGYRFYVDYIMEIQRLAAQEREKIEREYQEQIEELDNLLLRTSRMLSGISHYAGFVLLPKPESAVIQHLQILPLAPHRFVAVLITTAGSVHHKVLEYPIELSKNRLHAFNRFLSEKFQGQSLSQVRSQILHQTEALEREFVEMGELARKLAKDALRISESDEVYMEGTGNILSLPDFSDQKEARSLIQIMEEKRRLTRWLTREMEGEKSQKSIRVKIGSENPLPELQNLSLVASTYRTAEKTVGLLGILGPKNMEYSRMTSLVNYVSQVLNKALEKWNKKTHK
ncbi:MAG: heat-inducible transcription repressor HrcA [Elusimicrobia bacterium]|nr:heat-inducible transcription repressor HrcA [Elusimicrobiota bacterium]